MGPGSQGCGLYVSLEEFSGLMCGHRVIAAESLSSQGAAIRALSLGGSHWEVARWRDLLDWMFHKS